VCVVVGVYVFVCVFVLFLLGVCWFLFDVLYKHMCG